MGILEETEKMINEMRKVLYDIIDKKQNLLDLEVITASQELDYILNKYNKLLKAGK